MNTKALQQLTSRSITNWHPSCESKDHIIYHIPYFDRQPTSNCLYQHIQIYKLIQEYIELFEDYEKMKSSGKAAVESRMKEIQDKLLREYWIVSKNQKNNEGWTFCTMDF